VALRLEEVRAVWRALGDRSHCSVDPVTLAALQIIVLTGQRESEVEGAAWEEVDLSAGIWRIPAHRTKNARPHLVHLAPQAVTVLKRVKAITGSETHVFASPIKNGQAIYGRSLNNALGMMFKREALPTVTRCHVHDFRRTLISRLPDLGFDSFIGHKIANHTLPGDLGIYNHAEYLVERQGALYAWAEQIENAVASRVENATFVGPTRRDAPTSVRNRRGSKADHSIATRTSSRPDARYSPGLRRYRLDRSMRLARRSMRRATWWST